jgi:hypothetical protein
MSKGEGPEIHPGVIIAAIVLFVLAIGGVGYSMLFRGRAKASPQQFQPGMEMMQKARAGAGQTAPPGSMGGGNPMGRFGPGMAGGRPGSGPPPMMPPPQMTPPR